LSGDAERESHFVDLKEKKRLSLFIYLSETVPLVSGQVSEE